MGDTAVKVQVADFKYGMCKIQSYTASYATKSGAEL